MTSNAYYQVQEEVQPKVQSALEGSYAQPSAMPGIDELYVYPIQEKEAIYATTTTTTTTTTATTTTTTVEYAQPTFVYQAPIDNLYDYNNPATSIDTITSPSNGVYLQVNESIKQQVSIDTMYNYADSKYKSTDQESILSGSVSTHAGYTLVVLFFWNLL